ncbi:MAG: hypothetical protein GYB67_05670 [Chloroflexi bacterium]|nr:hypothetical protein [Chloroflexota bacterium]
MELINNPLVLGPVFIPLFAAVICLLLSRNNRLQRYVAFWAYFVGWLCSIVVLLMNLAPPPLALTFGGDPASQLTITWQVGVQTYTVGGWFAPFGVMLVADMLSAVFGLMATTVVMIGVLYAVGCKDKAITYPAFMPLLLTMGGGLVGCFYTGDIFTLFVFLELMVISSVILVAISDNRLGLEAAIKYLLISAMGTLFLLLGIAEIYASFGTLNLADVANRLQTEGRPLLAQISAVALMAAFLLKSAVFPFHFWQPDFHTTAPTPVGALLSSVVVKVGVYGLIRLTTLLFIDEAPLIQQVLIVLGVIGIFFGSLGALQTYNAKRLLAYSTFGQIGFILVAIGWGSPIALAAAIIYAFNQAFIKAALLMITGLVSSRLESKSGRLSEIVGAGQQMTFISSLYLIGGLALAGVPPLNGFISKVSLVNGGVDVENWLILGLVVGAGLLTMLYMIRTWQLIFQRTPEAEHQFKPYGDSPLAPTVLIGICVILGLYAVPLIDLANTTVAQIGDPHIYIRTVLGG